MALQIESGTGIILFYYSVFLDYSIFDDFNLTFVSPLPLLSKAFKKSATLVDDDKDGNNRSRSSSSSSSSSDSGSSSSGNSYLTI